MKKLQFVIFILFLVSLLGCTKVFDEVIVEIHIDQYFGAKGKYPTDIPYTAHGGIIDSICLIVDGEIHNTQYIPEENIVLVGEPNTRPIIAIAVYHHSGLITYSERVQIRVSGYYKPDVEMQITNTNGESEYFLGEQLKIRFKSNTHHLNINACQQMSLNINGIDLGILTEAPFIFESHVITVKENLIELEIIDELGVIHTYEEEIEVPVNHGPRVKVRYSYWSWADEYNILTAQNIIIRISGDDVNMKVDYVELFIDDELIVTEQIDQNSFNLDVTVDDLSSSNHDVYCIAYDERGASAKSDHINFILNTSISTDYDERITKMVSTDNDGLIFGISNSKLYKINPVNEEITEIIDLPFMEASSIDFVEETQTVYIGFNDGRLMSWDEANSTFETITSTLFDHIYGLKIDYSINKAIVSNNYKMYSMDLTSLDTIRFPRISDYSSNFGYDKNSHIIVCGGRSYFYKYELTQTSVNYEGYFDSDHTGNVKTILLHPSLNRFLSNRTSSITNIWSLNDFGNVIGEIDLRWPKTISYSYNSDEILFGGDGDDYFSVFDSDNLVLKKSYFLPLPNFDEIELMVPTSINNKVVLIVNDDMHNSSRIVFYKY